MMKEGTDVGSGLPRRPPPQKKNGHGDQDPGTGAAPRRHAYPCGFCAHLGRPGLPQDPGEPAPSRGLGRGVCVAAAGTALAASGGRHRAAQGAGVPAAPSPAPARSPSQQPSVPPLCDGAPSNPGSRPQTRAAGAGNVAGPRQGLRLTSTDPGKPGTGPPPSGARCRKSRLSNRGLSLWGGAWTRPFRSPGPALPLYSGRPWIAAGSYGFPGGPASGAPSPGLVAGRGAGALGRGLVVGSAGAERLRVPPAAVGQHAVGAARPGARPRPRATAHRPPRSAAAAPWGPRRGSQDQGQIRAAAARTRPGLGRPHPLGNPAADFRVAGGGRWAHALPRQGCARVPPLARGRLPASSLAHRDPVAPTGWPPHQRQDQSQRGQGRGEAPGLPGVADAQPVLTAPEADPHPLEGAGTPRVEGESLGLPCTSRAWARHQGTHAVPRADPPGPAFLSSPPAGRCQSGSTWAGAARGRREVGAGAAQGHPPLFSFPVGTACPPPVLLALCLLQLVSESCPGLTFLKLSDCHGVTPDALLTLARACPQLHSLDIQHSMVESTAVVSFLEEVGPRMRKLWLTYSPQTTAILGALLGGCCPQLRVLEVSTGINHSHTPLQLPVEALQKGCPQLQVLRLLNLTWLPKPSGRAVTPGPGFPSLEELCLASPTCSSVSNEALGRLLHGSPNLRLLDLRGCSRITPAGLHGLPCQELQQLHLGLYGMSDRLTLAKEGSPLLTRKWCHTLRELDLSGQGFSEKDLEQALAAFPGTPGSSHPALCSLNLRGTRVTPSTVSSVISSCPGLLYLNLESCRCLPRGLKRTYRGPEEVQWCLEQLLTSPPSPS